MTTKHPTKAGKQTVDAIHACVRAGILSRWMPPSMAAGIFSRVLELADHAKRAGYISSRLSVEEATVVLVDDGLITLDADSRKIMMYPPGLTPSDWPTPENGVTEPTFAPALELKLRAAARKCSSRTDRDRIMSVAGLYNVDPYELRRAVRAEAEAAKARQPDAEAATVQVPQP